MKNFFAKNLATTKLYQECQRLSGLRSPDAKQSGRDSEHDRERHNGARRQHAGAKSKARVERQIADSFQRSTAQIGVQRVGRSGSRGDVPRF